MNAVDLSWATAGYLWCPGRLRYIAGLERIAADARRLGVRVFWSERIDTLGSCQIDERVILLSAALARAWPFAIRRVLAHELGHIEHGADDEMAQLWSDRTYGELVREPDWGQA